MRPITGAARRRPMAAYGSHTYHPFMIEGTRRETGRLLKRMQVAVLVGLVVIVSGPAQARTISRLPTGSGLSVTNRRMSSRLGKGADFCRLLVKGQYPLS